MKTLERKAQLEARAWRHMERFLGDLVYDGVINTLFQIMKPINFIRSFKNKKVNSFSSAGSHGPPDSPNSSVSSQ